MLTSRHDFIFERLYTREIVVGFIGKIGGTTMRLTDFRNHYPVIGIFAALLLAMFTFAPAVQAAPTTMAQASAVVQHWLAQDPAPLAAALPPQIAGVTAYGAALAPAYFVVALSPTGYVIVAGDDRIEPIIAFVPKGTFDPSPTRTMGALVSRDLPGRLAQVQALAASASPAGAGQNAATLAQHKWSALLASRGTLAEDGIPSVSDPRVDPLTQTTWSQETANEDGKTACYNYYTPPYAAGNPANYPGWVRGHRHGATDALLAIPDHRRGYGDLSHHRQWESRHRAIARRRRQRRPLSVGEYAAQPGTGTPTAQCQAIGDLCSDAGVAVNMQYTADGSGAYDNEVGPALTSVFKYNNAIYAYADEANITPAVPQIVNADLDAGYPVIFGIYCSSTYEGHEIVCDGYGYDGNTLYHHLNLGWSGEDTAWYNLPNIGTPYEFNVVDSCTYNVYPLRQRGSDQRARPRWQRQPGGRCRGDRGQQRRAHLPGGDQQCARHLCLCQSAVRHHLYADGDVRRLAHHLATVTTGTSTQNTLTTGNVWGADIRMASPTPVLTLIKSSGSLNAYAGGTATYTLSYQNTGNAAASNVQLSDPLPAALNYVPGSASGNGSYTPATSTLSWALGSLPAGQSGQVTFQVTVNAGITPGTEITNTASIGATEVPTPVFSNIAVMTVLSPLQGDWWMFLHDRQHSGRSPYTGYASVAEEWAFRHREQHLRLPGAGGGRHDLPRVGRLQSLCPQSGRQRAVDVSSGDRSLFSGYRDRWHHLLRRR